MPASINGCGTRWYGKSLEDDDGSYVVTEWITFLWVPLIPTGSKRVTPVGDQQFHVEPADIHWPHIFLGYIPLAFLLYLMLRKH